MIGRKQEIKRIQTLLTSNRSEFLAITGRRRVGKTYLIDTLLKDNYCFSMTGIQDGNTDAQLVNFGIKLADEYFDSFFDHFESISNNPYSYQLVENIRSGYHRCINGSDSIYFRIKKDFVEIMAIVGRQDISNIF